MPCVEVELLWLQTNLILLVKREKNEVENLADIHMIESGDTKRFGDIAKDLTQQAHLVKELYPTSLDGAFELIVWRSGRYQSLG